MHGMFSALLRWVKFWPELQFSVMGIDILQSPDRSVYFEKMFPVYLIVSLVDYKLLIGILRTVCLSNFACSVAVYIYLFPWLTLPCDILFDKLVSFLFSLMILTI